MPLPRPNIVLFLTDDHAPWSLPCYGNLDITTPNFDRLARAGVRFRNAYTPTPVCSPARACILTGRTASQVGIHDWLQENLPDVVERDWLAGQVTLPELLVGAGYHTILGGKWHLGQKTLVPRGFNRAFGLVGLQGTHNGVFSYHQDGRRLEIEGNKSRIITDRALAMLAEAPADRPFFLNIGYIATHSPYDKSAHDPEVVRQAEASALNALPSDPPHARAKDEGLSCEARTDTEQIRARYVGYYAAVLELDREVGRVLDALEARGELENTLVVYVSDHGCSLGHNGFWGKGNSTRPLNMYEVSLRVPLLMAGPGIARDAEVAEIVDHYDLFQALCEAGGVERGGPQWEVRHYPGTSLSPLAQGRPAEDWPDTRYGEYGDLRMIRSGHYKLIRHYACGPDELYDLAADPGEKRNLVDEPEYQEVRATLQVQLEAWYQGHEDSDFSGLRVLELPRHNDGQEAWRDGRRELVYPS